ncbi:MAG: transglycosylase SLT domain-containing protein, partial [Bdellovibrionales bacterium]|nr:transglycosylase SLT domain-containing protein [Bdellovibrionales bacterium]
NYRDAEKAFKKVNEVGTSDYLSRKSKFHQAELEKENGKLAQSENTFRRLEREMRGSEIYPDILWALLKLSHKRKSWVQACQWARKLFVKYPTYEPTLHWGLTWNDNLVDGKPMNCKASLDDQKDRIRTLQHSGAADKAHEELKAFEKSKADPLDKDILMAEYLVNEGHVKEGLKRLLPHYPKNKKDFEFIGLLAKAASRAGEFQTAVGIYNQAAQDLVGTEKRKSIYRAAFLSYQHQDYDGAIRRFENLAKFQKRSSLARQANWYLPWLYYLKGNYQKAYDLFSKAAKHRRSMLPSSIGADKINYWMAMSQLKLGNKNAAKDLFAQIASDDYIGYYSIAAMQRLKTIVGKRSLAMVEQRQTLPIHENWLPQFNENENSQDEIDFSEIVLRRTKKEFFAEWEDLPFMREYLEMESPGHIFAQVDEPKYRQHLERAQDLSLIGNKELAKWELYTIESRTRNKDYLKSLMFEYHRNEVFHRSSYIGTRHFAGVRTHLGLHLGASIWQFVYPRAFETDVLAAATRFEVPPEFVWSIMKAETNFRPDAVSPVGAKGLMQVMTHTGRKVASLMGKDLEGDELVNPHVNIEIGTRYLKRVLKKFKGKIPLAAAAYNGGPHRVHGWLSQFGHLDMDEFIEHIPYVETRNYVKKVTRYYTVYNLLYNKDTESSSWLSDLVDVHLEGTPPTRETWEVL